MSHILSVYHYNRRMGSSQRNLAAVTEKLQASSENYFLRIWAEDFIPDKVMEIPEYFVYCGIFITHSWDKRFGQIPKGEFLEVPYNL